MRGAFFLKSPPQVKIALKKGEKRAKKVLTRGWGCDIITKLSARGGKTKEKGAKPGERWSEETLRKETGKNFKKL